MMRLQATTLAKLPTTISTPSYAYNEHGIGIMHIGIGAFHRGHQAVFTDAVLAHSGGDWRIVGVSLRSPAVAQQLNPQNGLYTVIEQTAAQAELKVIGSVAEVLSAPSQAEEVQHYLAASQIKVITLTVTEKGYHYDNQKKGVDTSSIDIQHDLKNPLQPVSMPGHLLLACILRMRAATQRSSAGAGKFSVISCDNLPNNGQITKQVVKSLAQQCVLSDTDTDELLAWIENNVSFCSSMVDRIVPKVMDEQVQQHAKRYGYSDAGLIITEPFKQWVIEDNFISDRPAWETVGVQFVTDVAAYEKLKLRTLNGAHSALAYMGSLLGYTYIHEAIADPVLLKSIQHMMVSESGPTIPTFSGFDLVQYQNQIIARFTNSEIAYETAQVAMDGSQKLPQRILEPLAECYAKGQDMSYSIFLATVVAWILFLVERTSITTDKTLSDPLASVLSALVQRYQDAPQNLLTSLFTETNIFSQTLQDNTQFSLDFIVAYQQAKTKGFRSYVEELVK